VSHFDSFNVHSSHQRFDKSPLPQHLKVVALKKIFDAFQNATDAQRTFREIMFLQELNAAHHDHIIRLLNVLKADNDRDIYLVFEYMEINLHAVIRAGILEDIHKKYIIYQCAKALKYMHSGELLHRDMKPSNILLNSDCRAKICDLGLARSLKDIDDGKREAVLTDYVATRWYRAPEILLSSPRYTKGVDMWSLGCILAELLSGKPLFPGESTLNQLERIIEVTGKPTEEDIASIKSKYAKTMIDKVVIKKQKPLESLFPDADPDALDLLKNLLRFNPDERLTAVQVLEHPWLAEFHDPANEPSLKQPVHIAMDDNSRFSISEYRKTLYKRIVTRKQELRQRVAVLRSHSSAAAAASTTHDAAGASAAGSSTTAAGSTTSSNASTRSSQTAAARAASATAARRARVSSTSSVSRYAAYAGTAAAAAAAASTDGSHTNHAARPSSSISHAVSRQRPPSATAAAAGGIYGTSPNPKAVWR